MIVNYKSSQLIEENLKRSSLSADHRVYVVDNYSDQKEREQVAVTAARNGWKLLCREDNPGFGVGANHGVNAAFRDGYEAVLLLNPDATISQPALDILIGECEPFRLISPVILDSSGKPWFQAAKLGSVTGIARHTTKLRYRARPDWVTAACLLIPRGGWEAFGSFRSDLFMYWEDVEFSSRWVRRGGELTIVSDAKAVHDSGGTQGAGKSALYVKYNLRNRRVVARDHGPARRIVWFAASPYYVLLLIRVVGVARFMGRQGKPYRAAALSGLFGTLPPR